MAGSEADPADLQDLIPEGEHGRNRCKSDDSDP